MCSVLLTTPHANWQLLPTFPARSDSDLAAHWHVIEKGIQWALLSAYTWFDSRCCWMKIAPPVHTCNSPFYSQLLHHEYYLSVPSACLFNFFLVKGCGVSCFATTIIPAISPYAHHGAACLGNGMLFPGQACTVTVPCHNRFTFHVSSWFSIYSHVWYRVTTLSRCCHRCDSSVPGMKMSPATIVSVDMTMLTPLCCCCCHHRFFFVAFPIAIIVVSSPFGIIVVE